MAKTRKIRYGLFGGLFFLVLVGISLHSYQVLVVLALAAIVLGVIGDTVENRPTEPYKQYNALHHHLPQGQETATQEAP